MNANTAAITINKKLYSYNDWNSDQNNSTCRDYISNLIDMNGS